MASGKINGYNYIFSMVNNHCLAFYVFSTVKSLENQKLDNQLYISSCLHKGVDSHLEGLQRPTGSDQKSNTNMHYEHTFLHHFLPGRS
jgi:hypothetical protein